MENNSYQVTIEIPPLDRSQGLPCCNKICPFYFYDSYYCESCGQDWSDYIDSTFDMTMVPAKDACPRYKDYLAAVVRT